MLKNAKIIAFNGSHRSEKGFTEIVLSRFLKGAESAKAQCEVLYPSKKKIVACESCGKCLFETPGSCKYNDDMGSIIFKMEEEDLLVFAGLELQENAKEIWNEKKQFDFLNVYDFIICQFCKRSRDLFHREKGIEQSNR
ncbi:MAG: flavodoxin family protein [Desulfobacteraceae bacterium]|nr:flavodoxin family protein [Desulfobacteraceae bacterium]